MSSERLEGIRRALKLARLTEQSVNVGLNRDGEAVKIEGVIQKVGGHRFKIRLDDGGRETVRISQVEYVEFS